jgi:multicomponent Na+:H+ antiporter subunit E
MPDRPARRGASLELVITRTLALALLWLVLVEGELRHPVIAVLAIVGATAISVALEVDDHRRIRLGGLLRFVPYFLKISLAAGFDVALRAFRRDALDPGLIRHAPRLPTGSPAQVFFTSVVSVVPGTLCADTDEDGMTIHVIDRGQDPLESIRDLEHHVAAMFGEAIGP